MTNMSMNIVVLSIAKMSMNIVVLSIAKRDHEWNKYNLRFVIH